MSVLSSDYFKGQPLSWEVYHASINPNAIISMLPLFYEKADSPVMLKHFMNLVKQITQYLKPGQAPVLACLCSIFAQAKYFQ